MALPRPSELELQILSILWERGPSSIRTIREALPDGKDRAYTTVLTLVQILEKKGFVSHTSKGQAHIYHPLVTSRQVLRPLMRDLLHNVFGGRPAEAVQCLLDSAQLDEDELSQIRQVIQNASTKSPEPGSPEPKSPEPGKEP
jgi:predicted transcriptional regulator